MLDRVGQDQGKIRTILRSPDVPTNPIRDLVFDENSLYAKILDRTLRSENVHAGNKAFYRSRVDRVVSGWESELGLNLSSTIAWWS